MSHDPSQPRPVEIETSTVPLDGPGSPSGSPAATVLAVGYSRETRDEVTYVVGAGSEAALGRLGVDVFELLTRAEATGKGGETVTHEILPAAGSFSSTDREPRPGGEPDRFTRVLLVGLGAGSPRDYRRAGAAVTRASHGGRAATSMAALADDDQLSALVEGLILGSFRFSRKSNSGDADEPTTPTGIVLTDLPARTRDDVIASASTRAMSSWRARTYALTPSNEKGPVQLERWASQAALRGGLNLEVWDDDRLVDEGFGGIVAVGSGSDYESRFLRLDYEPPRADRHIPHVVLIGKGITFDSGGLSIKTRDGMMNMKRDMTGAGVVIAVMEALRDVGVPVAVTGLVASAENAFGAASMRPGDVVTHYGGRTSEVGNTDAEGRLVLADGLAYAARNIDATAVVDIATLTGAGRVALGTSLGALFANDEGLATALERAGALAGEPVWRLPLFDEYEPQLDNTFADATNAAGGPGAITAALFLQYFVADVPWAHLDIASVGDSPVDAFEYTKGATGFGARLLLRWLEGLGSPEVST